MGAEQGRPVIWHLPFRQNPFFTGREQVLSDLHAMLLASASAALVQPPAISGLGGIGKTQTAIEYAYRYGKEYNTVLWMQASSRETLIADITRAATLLHLPEQDAREQDKIVQALKRWLEANSDWLLIFDNADDLHIVSDVLPARNSGHILFTTRATAMSDLAQRVSIDEMDRAEGSLLLLRRARILSSNDAPLTNTSEADLAAAQAIVEAVDGLPLALDQAGAYIEETQCSLADYLQLYCVHLLEEQDKRKDAHPEPVATTWALSFKNVQQANPAAADLLRLCAFLAPDDIPEAMFLEAPEDIGTELQSLVGNLYKLNMALKELLKYSLIRRDSTNHTIVVHRLVQAVLKSEMDEEAQKQWAERAIRIANKGFPYIEMETWPVCQQLLPHALVCASFIEQWDLAFPEAASLLNEACVYLEGRAQYQEAEPLLQRALAIHEEILGEHHPDTASSLNNLGSLYLAQGKLELAEPLYQRALAIREEVLGPRHPDTALSLNNLGSLYQEQGKLELAEPLYQRALAIREEMLGPRHPDTVLSVNNLAGLYQEQGKLAEAEPLFEQALAIREEILGSHHPNTAQSLNNLAGLYQEQGKLELVEPLYQRALAIREEVLGERHPDTALSLNNLGSLYQEQGKLAEAESLCKQALEILKQVLGPDHPNTRKVQNNYNILLQQMKHDPQ